MGKPPNDFIQYFPGSSWGKWLSSKDGGTVKMKLVEPS